MSEFVICVENIGRPASLVVGKAYRRLRDSDAESRHLIRVVDEDISASDGYLYPASMFIPLELPELLLRVTHQNIHREWDTGPAVGDELW
jgi:hypothetical protein